ncbi:hypothetical protein [Nocardioides sp. InS609-2]|uniref:hypothetical protein n=1 Tax=Nocardioides sp. InS609-2 TaxID=2760705 RepID=UPI0020BD82A1|nr:hypothetical protein [Nocardioides sp. InS609-2]
MRHGLNPIPGIVEVTGSAPVTKERSGIMGVNDVSMEIHPGEGGADAAAFAGELAAAVSKHTGATPVFAGGAWALHRL